MKNFFKLLVILLPYFVLTPGCGGDRNTTNITYDTRNVTNLRWDCEDYCATLTKIYDGFCKIDYGEKYWIFQGTTFADNCRKTNCDTDVYYNWTKDEDAGEGYLTCFYKLINKGDSDSARAAIRGQCGDAPLLCIPDDPNSTVHPTTASPSAP